MGRVRDRFHDYLDYCRDVKPVSVGDYIETVVHSNEILAWTRLMRDCTDTFHAGKLVKVKTHNGGVAYMRPADFDTMAGVR